MIRSRRKAKTTTTYHSKSCPFCGFPFAYKGNKEVYNWYINYSQVWQAIRAWAIERAQYKCQRCGSNIALQVHHKTYSRLGKEMPGDLIVLCEECHQGEHGR